MATIDPYKEIQTVYNAKVAYGQATTEEEKRKQQEIANKARQTLSDYGYKDIADSISANGATAEVVKKYLDNYSKKDKSKTRDYFYSLGKSHGLSNDDIDKLISWDNDTGQVSFGGKVVGTPDTVVDGVSYWSDTSKLDNAFNDYIERSGTTRSKSTAVDQENEGLFKKYNEVYDGLLKSNPFETEEGKAILAKYDLAGLKGRENEVASGGADNGGNIDSFAAANALRQQAALVNQGQLTAIEAHNQKIENARALLSDMGVNIDRVFNQDETAKNNQTSRDVATAEVTGVVPSSMIYKLPQYSQFFNEDGTLKDENIDFKAEINKAVARGDNELAEVLRAARGTKIYNNWKKYGQFAADGDYTLPGNIKTEAADQFDKTMDYNYKVIDAEKEINDANNQAAMAQLAAQINSQKLSGDDSFSEETVKLMDTAVKNMNALWKEHGSNTNKVDIIISDGPGKYRFNPEINPDHWDDLVVEQILLNKALSDNEKAALIAALDIDTTSMGYLT